MKTNYAMPFFGAAVLLAVAVAGGNLAQAQTCSVTWTGNAGDGLWSTAGNWSPRHVPGATSDVCIPTFGQADATPPISIHSLQISEGGSLIIESGKAGAAPHSRGAAQAGHRGGAIDRGEVSASAPKAAFPDLILHLSFLRLEP